MANPLTRIARLLTLALMALCVAVFALSLPLHWRELAQGCAAPAGCSPLHLTPLEREALHGLGLGLPLYAAVVVAAEMLGGLAMILMGGLVFWRRGRTGFGMLAALALVSFGALLTEGTVSLVRAVPAALGAVNLVQTLGLLTFTWLFLVFPNGRFEPRWAWLLGLPMLLARLAALAQPSVSPRVADDLATWLVYGFTLLANIAAQVYRYRRVSSAVERQQTKWVVLGLAGAAAGLLLWVIFMEVWRLPEGRPRVLFGLLGMPLLLVLLASFPVTLGFSILRYRLWDIDLIIRRAMLYGALTLCLGAGYFVSVIVFQIVLEAVAGAGQSQAAIVLSTLLQAALFDPLRRKLQELIDRRFYRSRYDMARVLAAFGARMRGEVDLDALRGGLAAVVNETLQPEWSAVWLRAPRDAPPADPPAPTRLPAPLPARRRLPAARPRPRLRPLRRPAALMRPALD